MPAERPDLTEYVVGPDLVQVGDETITIFARREMPDWTVREFCIVPIHFRDHKFYLKRRLPGPPPYACRYELAMWYPQLGAESTLAIHYDEDYVAERDRDFRTSRKQDHLHAALMPFFPFLGFCWSGFKERVLGPIGFAPRSISEASLMVGCGFWLLEVFFVVGFRAGFFAVIFNSLPALALDFLLVVALPFDCAIRAGEVIHGDAVPAGFLEWIFRRRHPGGPRY